MLYLDCKRLHRDNLRRHQRVFQQQFTQRRQHQIGTGHPGRVDRAALTFNEHGRLKFYGSKNLLDFLSGSWRPHWTHTMMA